MSATPGRGSAVAEERRESHARRTARLREQVGGGGWDACVLTDMTDIRYLSGFTGSTARMVVTPTRSVFITDFRYKEQSAAQVVGSDVTIVSKSYDASTSETLAAAGAGRIGLPSESITLAVRDRLSEQLPETVELLSAPNYVAPFRAIKDPWEIAAIERAVILAAEVFDSILEEVEPGVSEADLSLEIEFRMRRKGAEGAAFESIVASGWRSSLPHGIASDKEIEAGEFVTFDMGARLDGYHSDMTRTVCVGEPSEEMRKIYDIVLRAQKNGAENARPGMKGREADALCREIIEQEGYGQYFGHGTGHGIGLQVHEAPRLGPQADDTAILHPGAVYTVEPGIYLPGLGGVRIEDIVVMEDEGPRILTPNPRELLIL